MFVFPKDLESLYMSIAEPHDIYAYKLCYLLLRC